MERIGVEQVPDRQTYTNLISRARPANLSTDYDIVVELIPPRAKVLDLGCGSGELLQRLITQTKEWA